MKKVLSLVLAFILVFSLSACFGSDDGDGTITSNGKSFTIGTISGQTYSNDYINLTFSAPNGWVYYSEEEIAQINNVATEILTGDVSEALAQTSSSTIMFSGQPNGSNNVNIRVEKSSSLEASGLDSIEAFADYYIDAVPSVLESSGFTVVDISSSSIKIGKAEHPTIEMHNQYMGFDIYQRQILYVFNEHVVIVTITGETTSDIETITSGFAHIS